MKPLIIYHGDCNDGFGAALAAYLKFGDNAEYFAGMYDGVVPDVAGKDVMIFDYHFKEDILLKMQETANSLILKDHHDSAQKLVGHLACTHFDNSKSGAVLAWEHFFTEDVPEMFLWLQDRDLFQNKYPESSLLYYYLNSKPYDLKVWADVFYGLQNSKQRQAIFNSARDIEAYYHTQKNLVIKHHALPFNFEGEQGWIINAGRLFATEIGTELARRNNTFTIVWTLTDKRKINCSVRSTGGITAQVIAEKFGGGGHQHAAKFVMEPDKFFNLFLSKI